MDSFAAAGAEAEQASVVRPYFFQQDGGVFVPQTRCRSPWNPSATNGVAVAGLLAYAAERLEPPVPMLPAHITIDILKPVPLAPTATRARVTRAGRKLQIVESYLLAAGEPVARARVLRVRERPSPSLEAPMTFPPPEAVSTPFLPEDVPLASMIETRLVAGTRERPEPATIWGRFQADLTPGVPIEGVVQAAMMSDFGNGIVRPVDKEQWSFANVDISLRLARRPVGEWMLVHGDALLQGLGVGFSEMILADRAGPFGRAHQTLFIEPQPARADG